MRRFSLRQRVDPAIAPREIAAMSPIRKFSRNKLAVGLFGSNCDGGLACSTFPDRWEASWENCRELAVRADDAGIDFMLPLGRWRLEPQSAAGSSATSSRPWPQSSLGYVH